MKKTRLKKLDRFTGEKNGFLPIHAVGSGLGRFGSVSGSGVGQCWKPRCAWGGPGGPGGPTNLLIIINIGSYVHVGLRSTHIYGFFLTRTPDPGPPCFEPSPRAFSLMLVCLIV